MLELGRLDLWSLASLVVWMVVGRRKIEDSVWVECNNDASRGGGVRCTPHCERPMRIWQSKDVCTEVGGLAMLRSAVFWLVSRHRDCLPLDHQFA